MIYFYFAKIFQQHKIARHCPESAQPLELDWPELSLVPTCQRDTCVHAFVFLMKCCVSVFFLFLSLHRYHFYESPGGWLFFFHMLSSAPFPNLLDEAECWSWRRRQEGRWRASDLRFEYGIVGRMTMKATLWGHFPSGSSQGDVTSEQDVAKFKRLCRWREGWSVECKCVAPFRRSIWNYSLPNKVISGGGA